MVLGAAGGGTAAAAARTPCPPVLLSGSRSPSCWRPYACPWLASLAAAEDRIRSPLWWGMKAPSGRRRWPSACPGRTTRTGPTSRRSMSTTLCVSTFLAAAGISVDPSTPEIMWLQAVIMICRFALPAVDLLKIGRWIQEFIRDQFFHDNVRELLLFWQISTGGTPNLTLPICLICKLVHLCRLLLQQFPVRRDGGANAKGVVGMRRLHHSVAGGNRAELPQLLPAQHLLHHELQHKLRGGCGLQRLPGRDEVLHHGCGLGEHRYQSSSGTRIRSPTRRGCVTSAPAREFASRRLAAAERIASASGASTERGSAAGGAVSP